jgi:hypothetical protein
MTAIDLSFCDSDPYAFADKIAQDAAPPEIYHPHKD